jgi:hypothetical protein
MDATLPAPIAAQVPRPVKASTDPAFVTEAFSPVVGITTRGQTTTWLKKDDDLGGESRLNASVTNAGSGSTLLPHEGPRTFHKKSTYLKTINLKDISNTNWSRNTPESGVNETFVAQRVD